MRATPKNNSAAVTDEMPSPALWNWRNARSTAAGRSLMV
jgi:hypothetical protein